MSASYRSVITLAACALLLAAAACQAAKPATNTPSPTSNAQASRAPIATGTPSTETNIIQETPIAPLLTEARLSTAVPPTQIAVVSEPAISTTITKDNASALEPFARQDFGPWGQVLKIAWVPEGTSLAVSAGEDLHFLKMPGLEERLDIELNAWAPDIAYAPDGNNLATIDRTGLVRIWDADDGDLLQSIQAHQKSGSAVAYKPDGSLLASAGYDAMSRLWEVSSGDKQGEMIGGTFAVPAIAFTPDGASLAIVNGNIIRLRDVGSQRFVRTMAAQNPVFTIAINPDGNLLASGDVANTVQLWDMAAEASPAVEVRESLQTLPAQEIPVSGVKALVWQVAFNPDGSLLAAASGDGVVRIWEVESGARLAELPGHTKAATSLAFSPDGRWLASGGLDGQVILWGIQ